MITFIRLLLGNIIALLNWLTRGKKLKRSLEEQQRVEAELKQMALYQFELCPFCIKTRRVLHKLNLPITLFDAKNDQSSRQELLQQGGKIKVPCLRIDQGDKFDWMYESDEIIQFLTAKFGVSVKN